jgi:hypothetical protein
VPDTEDLLQSLANLATGYQPRAEILPLDTPPRNELIKSSIATAARIWPWFDECFIRPELVETAGVAMFRVAEDGRLQLFEASGAVAAAIVGVENRKPLAKDEASVYPDELIKLTERTAKDLAELRLTADEELRFERLWRMRAQGVTFKGERSAVALLQATGAFRRYVQGLPVLGRASINVTLGNANAAVTRWGIDWRRVGGKATGETDVVEPAEGARRALADLQRRRPERPVTLEDFKPRALQLGYVSLPRRQAQSLLEPAWVAILDPAGKQTSMGEVIAVPAAPDRSEPLFRPWRRARAQEGRSPPNALAGQVD